MIAESLGQDAVTTRKHVRVLPTLQLKSHPSIFAIGDILDWNEQKQLFKASGHASVITANILSVLGGSEPRKNYKTGPEMILVTNGKVSLMVFIWGAWMIDHPYRTVVPCTSVSCGGWSSVIGLPGCSRGRTWA